MMMFKAASRLCKFCILAQCTTFEVLNLGYDFDMPSTGVVEHVPDRPDVLGAADERGKDHIHALLDAKLEVGDILLGHGRELGDDAWHVDPLLLTEVGVVLDNGDNIVAIKACGRSGVRCG